MTAAGYKASSKVAMPEQRWGDVTPEQLNFEVHYLEVPALKQAGRGRGHHVERAKRARSLQGAGSASCDEGQGLHKQQETRQKLETPVVEQLQAATEKVLAMGQFIEATLEKQSKISNGIWAGNARYGAVQWAHRERALRMQPLREDARERALAHVGICNDAADGMACWGMQLSTLVREWDMTSEVILTPAMKREISDHFGNDFVMFLRPDPSLSWGDPDDNTCTTYTISLDMPWAERSLLMDAIDKHYILPVMRGARVAYLLVVGCRAWDAEKKRLSDNLAVGRYPEHEGDLLVQALREDARERALDHLGISSGTDNVPWGMQISTLVKNWDMTCEVALTPAMKRELTDHFGRDFVDFLKTVAWLRESVMTSANSPTHIVRRDMPWAKRFLLAEAIDRIPVQTMRDGGRLAYLLFFKGQSWKAERKKVGQSWEAERKKIADKLKLPCVES